MTGCREGGCAGAVVARGFCRKHYNFRHARGYVPKQRRFIDCTIIGCKKPHWAKGLCRTHYMRRWHKNKIDQLRQNAVNLTT